MHGQKVISIDFQRSVIFPDRFIGLVLLLVNNPEVCMSLAIGGIELEGSPESQNRALEVIQMRV
jgi:hypothetical protein